MNIDIKEFLEEHAGKTMCFSYYYKHTFTYIFQESEDLYIITCGVINGGLCRERWAIEEEIRPILINSISTITIKNK